MTWLTQRHGNPVRLEDFALMNGLQSLLDSKNGLYKRFSEHPKVQYDEKTDLWSYKVGARPDAAGLQCAQHRGRRGAAA